MATVSSRRPTTADSALSLLYDARNAVRRAMGVGPALESTDEILNAIRESMADRPDYVELEQSCVGVREVLNRGTNRKQDDHHLSLSALEAIDELTATANEIKKHIVKQCKRRAFFRAFRPKKGKEAIATWRLSLNRILCVLEIEFGSCESATVSGTHHDGVDPHTAVVDAHSGSRTPVSKVPTGVVNIHTLSHETDRDAANSGDGEDDPGCSTRVSVPDKPPRNACGTTPDVRLHAEKTHPTADAHEMFNGMPQAVNKGVCDNYQVAEESVPGESPPPLPKIFGRDELVKEIVSLVDADDPTPIALVGTGGIGKTSVALAVLHDDRIKQRFGHHRRFLRCDQFPPSLPNFLRRLSEVIGASIENPMDLVPLRPFLHRTKMLLVIDNAESLSDGPNTEDILPAVEELSRLRNIYLFITTRTSIVPARCKHIDVPTLSMGAARETFYNIYRRGEQSDTVNDILKQLDFHPLSITLLATAAKSNKWGIDQLEKQWEDQRTRVLRTRYHGSLAATIEFSLHSPMFRDLGPHARDLLGVVAFFPRGVDENNLDWLFPTVPGRRNIFDHFCVLSLTHRDEGFTTMLAPLRDHFRPEDPMSASLLCLAKERYFSRLSFSVDATKRGDDDQTRWITLEDVNVEHLLDIFTSADANSEAVWDACGHFMHHLFRDKPRIPVFRPKIGRLPDDYPSKPHCLSTLSSLCFLIGNYAEEQRLLCHALKLYRERGDDAMIAFTLGQLSAANFRLGLHEDPVKQAREAIEIYQRLGDVVGVVSCRIWLSSSFRRVNKHDDADGCETQVIGLIDTVMPTADPWLRAFFHASLCSIYSSRGNTEKGIFHAETSLGLATARSLRFTAYCTLARAHVEEGRLDEAEAHLEHARSLAANSSFELGQLMLIRACLLWVQGKFEEARSEAVCALDLVEESGGGDIAEEVKKLPQTIDKEMVVWASMGQFQASLAHWIDRRMIHAALGGDISQDEKALKAATKLMALLEKDGNRPGGPNFFQIRNARKELAALISHSDDKEANEAIAQSLAIPMAVDEPEEIPPPVPLMHQDNGPVVIWTTDPKLAHVGQLWQALYHVPQVRHRICRYRSPHPPEGDTKVDVDSSSGGTGEHALSAHEVFRHMELSGLAVVTVELSMERIPRRHWEGISPCEDVEEAYKELSEQVETSLDDGLAKRHPDWPRLFYSRINDATSRGQSAFDAKKDFSLISLGYNDGDESSDLMGCLTDQVFPEFPKQGSLGTEHNTTGRCATMEPADVIAFALARDESPPSLAAGRSQQQRKFSFPESFYMDQFVMTSRPHVQNANVAGREILRKRGSDLARVGNEDFNFMKSILFSLHYYENVARAPTDADRHAAIKSSAAKLKNVIAHIDAEWNAIGITAEQLKKESQNSSSSEQAQQNKYDLRAVLMHDGQKGREHVYSYINHEGAWWKVVDCTVTKVAFETVLDDKNGMDVGAGPFFLIYSRSLSEPLKSEWPETLENG